MVGVVGMKVCVCGEREFKCPAFLEVQTINLPVSAREPKACRVIDSTEHGS